MLTREEAKKLLPIIQAFAEGKTIQYRVSPSFPRPYNRDISYLKEWYDLDEDKCDSFSCDGTINYRIKPEPKYRPFKNQEECWNEMHKHSNFGWIKGNTTGEYKQIVRIYNYNAELIFNIGYNGSADYSPEMMFSSYTFADGTPFGIKEE